MKNFTKAECAAINEYIAAYELACNIDYEVANTEATNAAPISSAVERFFIEKINNLRAIENPTIKQAFNEAVSVDELYESMQGLKKGANCQ